VARHGGALNHQLTIVDQPADDTDRFGLAGHDTPVGGDDFLGLPKPDEPWQQPA
jgi:hypothetical protein